MLKEGKKKKKKQRSSEAAEIGANGLVKKAKVADIAVCTAAEKATGRLNATGAGIATPENPRAESSKDEGGTAAGRTFTVSIAVPGSVIDNVQTAELATAVAGQIARTAAIFNVDEVVVIDDSGAGEGEVRGGAAFLARVLQFMETPQYLRKALVPMHKDLRLAGLLPPLDAPHHMRAAEWCPYREGVVLRSAIGQGSLLNIGLEKEAFVQQALRPHARVTLFMGHTPTEQALPAGSLESQGPVFKGQLATPLDPREQLGLYWGYQTRIVSTMQALKSGCPFKGGYDLTVGTSERGSEASGAEFSLPPFKHLLVAFGGPLGLEEFLTKDRTAQNKDPRSHFDLYINTCPRQGSRTIRTEEALLISLAYLQPALEKCINATV